MASNLFPVVTEEMLKLPIHINGVGYNFIERGIKRDIGYPSYQWIQCEEGEATFIYQDKEILITPDKGLFILKNDPHAYYPVNTQWKSSWLSFDGPGVASILEVLGLTETSVCIVKNSGLLLNMIQHAFGLLNSYDTMKHVVASSYMYYFLTELVKNITGLDQVSHYQRFTRLDPVLAYINEHYSEPITIDDLADLIDVSPQYLCTLFRDNLGQRPFEYVNLVRINKSKELIVKNIEIKLSDICKSVGFDHPSYFGKTFKKIVGLTPGQFKQLHHL